MTQDQQKFLNGLLASGVVPVIGASAILYFRDQFDLTHTEAIEIMSEWMKTFRSQTSADICGND